MFIIEYKMVVFLKLFKLWDKNILLILIILKGRFCNILKDEYLELKLFIDIEKL